MDTEHISSRWGAMKKAEDVEEGCGAKKKAVTARAKEIMPSTKDEYGKKKGEDVAYAIAQKQVGESEIVDEDEEKWMQAASKDIEKRGTEGKCTPITKPGCTGKAKTLAQTFKKIAKNK